MFCKSDLLSLEEEIEGSLKTTNAEWIKLGLALGRIRDERLYEPLSFDAYLKQKNWKSGRRHITRRYADYLIAGAKTAKELATENNCSDLPNEAIAREVRKFPKTEQARRLEEGRARSQKTGRKPTAKDVRQKSRKMTDLCRTSGVSPRPRKKSR